MERLVAEKCKEVIELSKGVDSGVAYRGGS